MTEKHSQIAIAYPGQEADIWCDNIRNYSNGRISFSVINGGWNGSIKDGVLTVTQYKTEHPAEIVWRGKVPPPFSENYNEALNWIREEVKRI